MSKPSKFALELAQRLDAEIKAEVTHRMQTWIMRNEFLNAVVHVINRPDIMRREYRFAMQLNGHDHSWVVRVDKAQDTALDRDEIRRLVWEEAAGLLVAKMMDWS